MNRQFVKLKPYRASRKDYSHHKTHKTVVLGAPVLPPELLFLSEIKDQGALPQCTAYTACEVRESMKGKKYQTQPFWEAELMFDGDMQEQGSSVKTLLAVGVKTGFWPVYEVTAQDQATAYFFVSKFAGQDLFDSIRLAIFQQQRPIAAGLIWYNDFENGANGLSPVSFKSALGGHAVKIAGWKTINGTPYLAIQNSWGLQAPGSDGGLYYFSRELANKAFGQYGLGYWSDDPTHKPLGFISAILQNIVQLYTSLISKLQPKPPAPLPTKPEEVVTHVSLIEPWAHAIEAEESSRPPKLTDRNVRNCNPGNLRYTELTKELGATGHDSDNFCLFPNYGAGLEALCKFLTLAAQNQLKAYKDCTLLEFTQIYANPPNSDYAENVAKKLNIKVGDKISQLL